MTDLPAILALGLILTGVGLPLARRLAPSAGFGGAETRLLGFAIGGIIAYWAVMGVGILRLDRLSMGAVFVALAAGALPGLRLLAGDAVRLRASLAGMDVPSRLAWLAVAVVALSSLLQGMAPPNDYDSLMYHLALPKRDVEAGRIEVAWITTVFTFFPQLMGHLYRLWLPLMGEHGVQMISGLFGLAATAATALLAGRLGATRFQMALAALMFIAIRGVIWEMASCEVDVGLAAFAGLALIAAMAWRDTASPAAAAALGLAMGGALATKYLAVGVGLALAVPLGLAMLRRRLPLGGGLLAVAVCLAAAAPHLIRNYLAVGNPVFPLLGSLFNPDALQVFAETSSAYGPGQRLSDLVLAPWRIFMTPHAFDGMMIGSPYLLAAAPAAALYPRGPERSARWGLAVWFLLAYFLLWFYVLSQQVRFLLPLFPLAAALAALGCAALWRRTAESRILRAGLIAGLAVLAANQSAFVAIYSAIRLPAALGLVSAESFHRNTPTMQGAFYSTCTYVANHLRPGERYLALIWPHSSYCPQKAAVVNGVLDRDARAWMDLRGKRPFDPKAYVSALEELAPRFVLVQTSRENRATENATPEIVRQDAGDGGPMALVLGVVDELRPLAAERFSAVYDGPAVVEALRRKLGDG